MRDDMRRTPAFSLCCLLTGFTLAGCAGTPPPAAESAPAPPTARATATDIDELVADELAALELQHNATVGVMAIDTRTGESLSYGEDRRFGFASTIKAFAAAVLLQSVSGAARDEIVHWTAEKVAAGHAPVTSQHVNDGLTYAQLAEAAVRVSDNTVLNLIVDRVGGPAALDDALAELGDATTEVVNDEPALNTIEPGNTDDTTTAAAFTASLTRILDGSTLSAADSALLVDWMSDNRTGDALIRSGAPAGWTVADKSGGAGPIRNDIAVLTRPGRDPIIITVLTSRNDPNAEFDDTLVASAASITLHALDHSNS